MLREQGQEAEVKNEKIHIALGVSTGRKERHGLMLEGDTNNMYRRCYANSWKDKYSERKVLLALFQASPLLLYGVDPFDPFVDLAFLFASQTSFKLRNLLVLGWCMGW